MSSADTIFALSSGRPPAAIAVIRVSGPRVKMTLETLAGRVPAPRQAMVAALKAQDGTTLDESVVLFFAGPASATGEDIAEFHVHGGRAVIAAVVEALSRIDGLRPAEPGEFTRRAFANGKLDLTAAEAVADLINADTDRQRRQALRQLQGLLGPRAESWRQKMIAAAALVEASIDFSDEGDVPQDLRDEMRARMTALKTEIEETIGASAHSERLREGLVVAIAGPPNAGKSTLLNRLARREAAIVSPYAGTTRDIIEVHLDLDGYPVTLLDTAGIRDSDDPVEQEGVRRARARATDADLVLWIVDAVAPAVAPGVSGTTLWQVANKIDAAREADQSAFDFAISAVTGEGTRPLAEAIARHAAAFFGGTEQALITRARHRQLLGEASAALGAALEADGQGEEIVAENLRIAIRSLGRLVGRVDVEDILGSIFAEFCIGK
jgi:tRNA modification GTPase